MYTLIETLSDGTRNFMVDLGELGVFFLSMYDDVPGQMERWCDHIEAYPEHNQVWCDIQVPFTHALN